MALHFELVTPEKLVRSEDVHMVVVPGTEGDFGVLEGHAPLMAVMRTGELTIYSNATTVAARIAIEGERKGPDRTGRTRRRGLSGIATPRQDLSAARGFSYILNA
jgi:F-type H+-transporting ATPase subunit epsilon